MRSERITFDPLAARLHGEDRGACRRLAGGAGRLRDGRALHRSALGRDGGVPGRARCTARFTGISCRSRHPPSSKTPKQKQMFFAFMHISYRILLEKGLRELEQTVALGERTADSSAWIQRARDAREEMRTGPRGREGADREDAVHRGRGEGRARPAEEEDGAEGPCPCHSPSLERAGLPRLVPLHEAALTTSPRRGSWGGLPCPHTQERCAFWGSYLVDFLAVSSSLPRTGVSLACAVAGREVLFAPFSRGALHVCPGSVGTRCRREGWRSSMAEHLFCKQVVRGSSPLVSSSIPPRGKANKYAIRSGGLPEWPKGADCKSAGYAFDGSNPSPSTAQRGLFAGVAQLVERQPSKLNVAGSNPVSRSIVETSTRKRPSKPPT